MAECRIDVLGPPRILVNGEDREHLRHKAIAMLVYLLVEDRDVGRDTLATLFWPGSGQSGARRNLRTALHEVRAALIPGAVQARADLVRLDRAVVSSDYHELVDLAATDPPDYLCDGHDAARTLRLLGGGGFLEGFTLADCAEFDDWQLSVEETVRSLRSQALHAAGGAILAGDASPHARDVARAIVRVDPLDEEGHRLAMRLYAAAGDAGAARRQYRRCVEILREELDAHPDPETVDLAEHIRTRAGRSATVATPSPRSPLPAEPDAFHGRDDLVERLRTALTDETHRLVTVTGTAGTGKTRLAMHAVPALEERFPDGVVFADLTAASRAADVPAVVRSAVGLRDASDDAGGLADQLDGRRTLIVLDNYEHVIEAAGLLADLVARTRVVRFLVTSREPLATPGEVEIRVDPLPLPASDDPSDLTASPAVALLLDRAAEAGMSPPALTRDGAGLRRLCERLDGLPLALELAVPLLKIHAPATLAERLGSSRCELENVRRGVPSRHSSLERAIGWSYDLLSGPERRLFAELSVFAGWFDFHAAEGVLARGEKNSTASVLRALVEKNLLQRSSHGPVPRFRLLESTREYASARLASDFPRSDAAARHAAWHETTALELVAELGGPRQLEAQARLAAMHGDIVAAMGRLERSGEADRGLRLAADLVWYWYRSGRFRTGREWTQRFMDRCTREELRCRGLLCTGMMAAFLGEWRRSTEVLARCAAASERVGDVKTRIRALGYAGVFRRWLGDSKEGWQLADTSLALARSLDDRQTLTHTLVLAVCTCGGEFPGPPPFDAFDELRRLADETGDCWSRAHAENGAGDLYTVLGDAARARSAYERSVRLFEELDDRYMVGWNHEGLGRLALRTGDAAEAERATVRALAAFDSLGDELNVALMLARLADVASRDRDGASRAGRFAGAALTVFSRIREDEVAGAPQILAAFEVIERVRHADPASFDDGRALSRAAAVALARRATPLPSRAHRRGRSSPS